MVIEPQIYTAKVMHKRLFPKKNVFYYNLYYLVLPLPAGSIPGRLVSFHAKDLGQRDGSDPAIWVRAILADYGLDRYIKDIILVTMPRVLGYVFNPISFYFCLDHDKILRSVLCEVHNTFGEQHSYLCANPDHVPISSEIWLEAKKVFHVSPFLERTGNYKFRFDLQNDKLGVWIDYYDAQKKKQLVTSLTGTFSPLNEKNLRYVFWRHPLVTLKAITFIHWQALRLFLKGVRYGSKPSQIVTKITTTRNLDKM
ncbi:hypothetical protein B488_01910 [Liberibacter crescens BT-1]|uniref:DUF1365 domain-containing protein n=1 Tax=Liberibacter crescens (strain BT-1) TaxID=1215343 RepID=L0ERR2_LIBCB|nr:DUF1365 domain-containing protein [Liberibacter crescens]AGA64184.1 hypothetical protein B488_01910 [Liberibacter crescens BT-1]AMC12444.1 hypothetical protein RL73_01130 [Liberibacter crescens]